MTQGSAEGSREEKGYAEVARGKGRPSARERADAWMGAHPRIACAIVGASVALALTGLFAFVTFSGFGASAEFIYNQF